MRPARSSSSTAIKVATASLRERDWRNSPGRSMEAFLYSPRRMCRIRELTLTTGAATRGLKTSDWGGRRRFPRPNASQ